MTESIVGIDPSLTGTAVAIMDQDCIVSVKRLSSEAAPTLEGRFDRYVKMVRDVQNLIQGLPTPFVLIEGYSMGSKGQGLTGICEYGGLLRHMLLCVTKRLNGCVVEVAPTCLKKFVTGKGNGDKLAVCLAISKRYDVDFKTNDEFDAYGLMQMGVVAAGWEPAQNAGQKEAIEKLGIIVE